MTKFKLLLGSRKFWGALIGLALIVLKTWQPDFPLSEEQLTGVVYVLVAYILGTGIEDGFSQSSRLAHPGESTTERIKLMK